jgi:hypothetical protein
MTDRLDFYAARPSRESIKRGREAPTSRGGMRGWGGSGEGVATNTKVRRYQRCEQ